MKPGTAIALAVAGAGILVWNILEYPDYRVDTARLSRPPVPGGEDAPALDWSWFDRVKLDTREGGCRLLALPPELEQLDGRTVTVAGASFACGDDLEEKPDGYTITGFVLVPYFGMIDCCIGNPIPYYQWTLVVRPLQKAWTIPHRGLIDPNVVVRGNLRIERGETREGVFWLDRAEVIRAADDEAAGGTR